MAAIWKDEWINLGTGASKTFSVAVGGATIYAGKGYRKSGEQNIRVRINDICADYLAQNLPTLTDGAVTMHPLLQRDFIVTPTDGTAVTKTFHLDWSYDDAAPTANLSVPIRMKASAGQPIFDTVIGAQDKTTVSVKQSGSVTLSGGRTVKVDMCEEWSLLYVNAYGGWDSLTMAGRRLMTDTYERRTARKEGETSNYANGVTRAWEMHTGWLTEAEAGRMHHLLGSTLVYLYNNETGAVQRVVLRNGDCPYKTMQSNNRELIDYTLNIEVAREQIRR